MTMPATRSRNTSPERRIWEKGTNACRLRNGSCNCAFSMNAITNATPGPAIACAIPAKITPLMEVSVKKCRYMAGTRNTYPQIRAKFFELLQVTAHHTAIPTDGHTIATNESPYTSEYEPITAIEYASAKTI